MCILVKSICTCQVRWRVFQRFFKWGNLKSVGIQIYPFSCEQIILVYKRLVWFVLIFICGKFPYLSILSKHKCMIHCIYINYIYSYNWLLLNVLVFINIFTFQYFHFDLSVLLGHPTTPWHDGHNATPENGPLCAWFYNTS